MACASQQGKYTASLTIGQGVLWEDKVEVCYDEEILSVWRSPGHGLSLAICATKLLTNQNSSPILRLPVDEIRLHAV